MIIGFLGKGGSGKSTIATLITKTIAKKGHPVLAVDADHNMDLSFNLGVQEKDGTYLGTALPDLLDYCGLKKDEKYPGVFFRETFPTFAYTKNRDTFTQKYARNVDDRISVMIAGPHTEHVLHGAHCSHSLVTPLKVYLPLLALAEDEFVIVDEKAGADGAGAGISTGFDVACVVTEPTAHGIKSAKQICELLDYYETPFIVIGNKVLNQEDIDFLNDNAPQPPIFCLSADPTIRNITLSEKTEEQMDQLLLALKKQNRNNRKERSVKKFTRNKAFIKSK